MRNLADPRLSSCRYKPLLARDCPTEMPSRYNYPTLKHLDGAGGPTSRSPQQLHGHCTTRGDRITRHDDGDNDPYSNLLSISNSGQRSASSQECLWASSLLLAKSALPFLTPPSSPRQWGEELWRVRLVAALPHHHCSQHHFNRQMEQYGSN